jgi:hypothetical protein
MMASLIEFKQVDSMQMSQASIRAMLAWLIV